MESHADRDVAPVDTDDRGTLSRRRALGGLAALGFGAVATTALVSGCDDKGAQSTSSGGGGALTTDANPKSASDATKAANKTLLDTLPFNDKADFEDAKRGLIARPET